MNFQLYSTSANPLHAVVAGLIGFSASLASLWIKTRVDRGIMARRLGLAVINEATTNLRLLGTWKDQLQTDKDLPSGKEAAASPSPLHTAALQAATTNAAFAHLPERLEFQIGLTLEVICQANIAAEYRQLYRAFGKGRTGYEEQRKAMSNRVLDVAVATVTSIETLRRVAIDVLKLKGRALAYSNLAIVLRPGEELPPSPDGDTQDN